MMPNAPRNGREQKQRQQRYRENQASDLFWLSHQRSKESRLTPRHIADVPRSQSVASQGYANVHTTMGAPSIGAEAAHAIYRFGLIKGPPASRFKR